MRVPTVFLAAALTLPIGACSWLPTIDEMTARTDPGVSPTGSQEALWLAAPRPGLSVVAKDSLFVGPMSVNRDGVRRSYLWFGVGTTIDRRLTGAPAPGLDSVVIIVNETPMTFDLIPWDSDPDAPPYPLSIDSHTSYAARITNSQLRQMANADRLSAYVVDANGRSPTYEVVEGSPSDWVSFGGPYAITRRD